MIFFNFASSAASAGVWHAIVYTDWHRGETESGIYKIFEKNTIFNAHPVCERSVGRPIDAQYTIDDVLG